MIKKIIVFILKLVTYLFLWLTIILIGALVSKRSDGSTIVRPIFLFASFIVPYFLLFTNWFKSSKSKVVSVSIHDRVEDLIAGLSEKELKIFADENNLNLEDHNTVVVFIQSLSEKEAEVIVKKLEKNTSID